jgi:hypothetical protein
MKHGMNYQKKRGARWEVLCGKVKCTKGVGRAQAKREKCQVCDAEHQWG